MNDDSPQVVRKLIARFDPDWPPVIDVRPGWLPLLARLDGRLSEIAPDYVVQQIKSKFGSLSFYARSSTDPLSYDGAFNAAIRAAEWESTERCEECGEPARTYTIHLWVWTLCEGHADELRTRAASNDPPRSSER